MLFGNADGVLNDFDQDPPVIDYLMLPNDIGYEFCVFGAQSVSYTIEAQSTDCVITLSKNGGIVKGELLICKNQIYKKVDFKTI